MAKDQIEPVGNWPHPSYIQVAKPYIFEQDVQRCFVALETSEAKEDNIRLQGVSWIDTVRKALQLPVKTFNTAAVYYHKFRLVHKDTEYIWVVRALLEVLPCRNKIADGTKDAAAAALFLACKTEDTLKKSREILCAAYNIKASLVDQLSPDDAIFEQPSRTVIGLERLMLESAGFDFRNTHPQALAVKLVKACGLDRDTVGNTAFYMTIDAHRTFAPVKQTSQTIAIACVELAARMCEVDLSTVVGPSGIDLQKWSINREQVMGQSFCHIKCLRELANATLETLLDLLDLYTHHRGATTVGPNFTIESFISTRITLNKEASAANFPRYTEWHERKTALNGANGSKISPASPASDPKSSHTVSPNSPSVMGPTSATGAKSRVGERGKDGTVRFMVDPQRAREEKATVEKYFAPDEFEEYEEERWVPIRK
ncbi:hypothetical protein BT93_L4871 [Corymbia citriodora subsp. variegata]|uniref:Cyclin n=1 Tax=Corymbia citriodora subsp. variegata TaxID=360336 RepID=A0A8T0CFG8_CORYI|nr:hypothetical protein BT93_L4871 [Corymbia citriodora subsp. variegata]